MEHKNFKNRVGEVNKNFQGLEMKITEYRKATDMTVVFVDGTIVKKTAYKEFSSGAIKNLNHPSIFGKGFMGDGEYMAWEKVGLTKQYTTWFSMLSRCYNEKERERYPTYKGVTICDDWCNFQIFAEWFDKNYIENWEIDKDIICTDCKTYSPETCVFVPKEINSLFTGRSKTKRNLPTGIYYLRGRYQVSTPTHDKTTYIGFYKTIEEAIIVYRVAKEKYMKEVAEIWKDVVDPRVYEAIYSFKVKD